MGAFQKIFGNWKKPSESIQSGFRMLNGYSPTWTNFDGGVYDQELARACVHTFATHCSKLQPNVKGADKRGIRSLLETRPNIFMTSSQFLYKVATIYEVQNTAFIVPILDPFERLIGFYPVNPAKVEIVDVKGEPWLRYTFNTGEKAAMELSRCGVVSKYLYSGDIKGESNAALNPTLQLLNVQNQGIKEGIKNSASFRFMATLNNFAKKEDITNERSRWVEENLSADAGGLALFPNTYTNIQQIQSNAKLVDAEQMKIAQDRILNYFGCNEDILQNKAVGDSWSAYYEGKIEPFSVQLSQAMTSMVYNHNELTRGNVIEWTSNRLQYQTNGDKLQMSSQMFDRGIFTLNQVLDVWNLPHDDVNGDKRFIRKEYIEVSKMDDSVETEPTQAEPTESKEGEE